MRPHLIWLILSLGLIRGFVYVSIIPPWQAPDEEFHFAQARLLLPPATGQTTEDWQQQLLGSLQDLRFYEYVPQSSPPATVPERYSRLTRNTPPYWLYALAALPWIDHELVLQLYVMRLVSVIISVGTLALVYLSVKELFPADTFIPIVAPVLVLFIPQHSYINASINDGNLAEFAVSLTLYFLMRAILDRVSVGNVVLILSSTTLAVLAKQTAYFLAIVVIGVLAFTILPRHRRHWLFWIGSAVTVISVAWLFWWGEYLPSIFLTFQEFGQTLYTDPFISDNFWRYGLVGYRSFWASLGWHVVTDDYFWWEGPTLALLGLALVGVLLSRMGDDSRNTLSSRQWLALGGLGFALLLAIIEFILINGFLLTIHHRIQGRYLYVAVLPLAVLLAFGWRRLVPKTWPRVAALALVVLLLLFDSAILFMYQMPFYFRL
jgi:4-amino-4-deoxy-L-arabinose transferase-like glycosyltransferase